MIASHFDPQIRKLLAEGKEVQLQLVQLTRLQASSTDENYRAGLAAQIQSLNRKASRLRNTLQTVRHQAAELLPNRRAA